MLAAVAAAGESLAQAELHRRLGVDRAAAHKALHRLLERGLVVRDGTPIPNGRGIGADTFTLTVTDTGREAAASLGVADLEPTAITLRASLADVAKEGGEG